MHLPKTIFDAQDVTEGQFLKGFSEKQFCSRFELGSLIPFCMTITIMLSESPSMYVCLFGLVGFMAYQPL